MQSRQEFQQTVATRSSHGLRGHYDNIAADFTVAQDYGKYSPAHQDVWRRLYARQTALIDGRACQAFVDSIAALARSGFADAIPRFDDVNEALAKATGWRLVPVPGLLPDAVFFEHLANRRFPVTVWIREPEEFDYIAEPDLFHDFFGHVPLLFEPVYADYMAAYGRLGQACAPDEVDVLTRLYWYVVEFGLVVEDGELKAFGAGIVSSAAETLFATTSPSPHRVGFDLERILRTRYRIDDFQQTYFVLDRFEQLTEAAPQGLAGRLRTAAQAKPIAPDRLCPGDRIITRGDQSHARRRGGKGVGDA